MLVEMVFLTDFLISEEAALVGPLYYRSDCIIIWEIVPD